MYFCTNLGGTLHMDDTTTATSGRAASGGGRVEKMGGHKNGPRKKTTPKKKPKPKQVQLPFDGGSEHRPEVNR